MIELPPRTIVVPEVTTATQVSLVHQVHQLLAVTNQIAASLLAHGDGQSAWYNDHLHLSHTGREDEAPVVAMHHHHDANGARGEPPGVLVGVQMLATPLFHGRILVRNVKHLGEVLSQVMRRGSLQNTTLAT